MAWWHRDRWWLLDLLCWVGAMLWLLAEVAQ
jgi:hypothetical protein